MKFVDLFSGIGGFRLGMEMAGHKCVGHCEWDKFADKSYRAMHDVKGDEWYGSDIREVRANELPTTDVWCFGFPCQDISVAGRQIGFDGKRSSLFFTVTKLIRHLEEEDKPSILFIENVKNLFSVNRGVDFLKLLIELDEIGYDAEWQLLNSKHFGVPQNRERVFIIGHFRGQSRREVFPIGESYTEADIKQIGNCMPTTTRDNPNQGRVYDTSGVSPCLNKMDGGGREPLIQIIGTLNPDRHSDRDVMSIEGISSTLAARDYKDPKMIAIPVLTPDRAEKRQNGRRFKEDGEPMFTLTGQDRHGVAIWQRPRGNNKGGMHDIAPTITKNSYEHNNHLFDGARIRRLTPRECFRLQGFPDEYFERAAAVNSDSQLYKQAGNSVTVNVIYEIAKRL